MKTFYNKTKKTLAIVAGLTLASLGNVSALDPIPGCTPSEASEKHFYLDAQVMAYRMMENNMATYGDSTYLSPVIVDKIYSGLCAIYNSQYWIPQADTVVNVLQIHAFPQIIGEFYLEVDSNEAWVKALIAGQASTGNSEIDKLLADYNIIKKDYHESIQLISLSSDKPIFVPGLVKKFKQIKGVNGGGLNTIFTIWPMDNIEYEEKGDMRIYTFTNPDMEGGCCVPNYYNVYRFIVDKMCVPALDEVSSSTGVDKRLGEQLGFEVFPNPVTDAFNVKFKENNITNFEISLVDVTGRVVVPAQSNVQLVDVKDLQPGIYVVRIMGNGLTLEKRFVKM